MLSQIFFRDETSDKPKENRVVKFHDEAPERGRPAKKSMKVTLTKTDSHFTPNFSGEERTEKSVAYKDVHINLERKSRRGVLYRACSCQGR